MIKLYKLDHVRHDFTLVFIEVGLINHINPDNVVMLLRTDITGRMRKAESWEPPILCITKIIMRDGTIYYTDEPMQEIQRKLFGGDK